jgi:nicotinamide riboside kinase
MKIAIVGAHGSGKSTIISSVYSRLKKNNSRVFVAPEVARSSLFLAAGEKTPKMQMDLFGRQISSEMSNSRNCDILLCDRSLFDILMYTRLFFKSDEEAISYSKSMSLFCENYSSSYDHVFLTSKLYSPSAVKDDIRPEDENLQREASKELKNILNEFSVNYTVLGTNPEECIVDWIDTNCQT